MKLARCFFSSVVAAITLLFGAITTYADVQPPQVNISPTIAKVGTDNGWHFLVAPYGWMPAIDGEVTVKDTTHHVFIPFSKILSNLDFAGEIHLEANRGRLTFMLDPTYLKVTNNFEQMVDRTRFVILPTPVPVTVPVTTVLTANETLTSATTLIDGGIFYRLFSGAPAANQYASFEILGGGRYFGTNNSFEFRSSRNTTIDQFTFERLRSLDVSSTNQLIAPIVGARIKYDPSPRWHLWVRGDGGGFNVDNMQSTWSATGGIGFTVHPHIDLGLAYRALDIKFTQSNAAMNVFMYGPMAGIAFYS